MCSGFCKDNLEKNINYTIDELNNDFFNKQNQLANCITTCLKNKYEVWSKIVYKNEENETLQFCIQNAFTDAMLQFFENAQKQKLYNSVASTQTVLFNFYKYKLLQELQYERRRQIKANEFVQNNLNDNDTNLEPFYKKLEKGLSLLKENEQKLILARHLQNKTIKEIALEEGINIESTTNKVYRCMQRLRQLIEKM